MSPCLMETGAVETTPLLSSIKKNIGDDDTKSPRSGMNDDNRGGGDSLSLCDQGTVVQSMVEVGTSSKPGVAMRGTKKNFTCSAIPVHQGKAMGVEEPQDRPKCEYTKEGMCLTHLKQATERLKASWVTKPGPGGRIIKKYQKKYYWQCDLDPRSRKTSRQTRLSFSRKPSVVQQGR